jgi:hypothetical protein
MMTRFPTLVRGKFMSCWPLEEREFSTRKVLYKKQNKNTAKRPVNHTTEILPVFESES